MSLSAAALCAGRGRRATQTSSTSALQSGGAPPRRAPTAPGVQRHQAHLGPRPQAAVGRTQARQGDGPVQQRGRQGRPTRGEVTARIRVPRLTPTLSVTQPELRSFLSEPELVGAGDGGVGAAALGRDGYQTLPSRGTKSFGCFRCWLENECVNNTWWASPQGPPAARPG